MHFLDWNRGYEPRERKGKKILLICFFNINPKQNAEPTITDIFKIEIKEFLH